MSSRRSFKTDMSFLEKISAGAIGTRRVFEDLKAEGHLPIELRKEARWVSKYGRK